MNHETRRLAQRLASAGTEKDGGVTIRKELFGLPEATNTPFLNWLPAAAGLPFSDPWARM